MKAVTFPSTGIRTEVEVDAPIEEVFAWHTRPGALTRLIPPFGLARVVDETVSLADGEAVLTLPGGVRWTSRHQPQEYDPPYRFVDVGHLQLTGQQLPWRHEHRFEPVGPDRTLVTDIVSAPVPRAVLAPMFTYRQRQLRDDLAVHAQLRPLAPEPLTVAITGASGLIGSALSALLTTGGHRVIRLVRRPPRGPDEREWTPSAPTPDLIDGVDVLVHLAGEPLAGRFTDAHKQAVRDSRVWPTRLLAELAGDLPFVCASAIGYYGTDRGEMFLDEEAEAGEGFLAEVVQAWEASARQATGRVVHVRTGIVQAGAGGALALQRPLFMSGLGGRIGSGEQWMSWIALDDVIDVYYRAITDRQLSGPVNAVAPHAVRNAQWARTMGRVLRRPTVLSVPEMGPRMLLGAEGAAELALASQRVVPAVLQRAGHRFRFPELEPALRHELGAGLTRTRWW